jgi:hypothetical protein
MAQKDSRRLSIVMYYLYPNLKRGFEGDYHLQKDASDAGTYVVWYNTEITKPTDQELANAKEDAVNDWWWKLLRLLRNKLLDDTDKYAVSDRPNNTDWLTYRQELRDLPTAVTKPDFETLNNQSDNKWIEDINSLMPTKRVKE